MLSRAIWRLRSYSQINDEPKIKKEDTSSASTPDKTSPEGKETKSNQSDSPNIKKKAYVRGESQKPVTKEYRDNWDSIFKKG